MHWRLIHPHWLKISQTISSRPWIDDLHWSGRRDHRQSRGNDPAPYQLMNPGDTRSNCERDLRVCGETNQQYSPQVGVPVRPVQSSESKYDGRGANRRQFSSRG